MLESPPWSGQIQFGWHDNHIPMWDEVTSPVPCHSGAHHHPPTHIQLVSQVSLQRPARWVPTSSLSWEKQFHTSSHFSFNTFWKFFHFSSIRVFSVIVLICNLTFHFPHSLSFISFFLLLISAFFSQTSFSHSLFLLCPLSYSLYFLSSFFKAILISKLCKSSHPCSLTYIYSNCSSLFLRDYSIWPMLLATASLDPTSSISNQAVILAGHLAALDKTGLWMMEKPTQPCALPEGCYCGGGRNVLLPSRFFRLV